MLPNKAETIPANVVSITGYRQQLEELYARRSALETLIQSLQKYDRFRAKRCEPRKRKTA